MAEITREQKNVLTMLGVACKDIRTGLRRANDKMAVYIARGYLTPTDDELAAAGFDYTAADILAAVGSLNDLSDFFDNVAPVQGTHGKNIDIIRVG